MAKSSRQNVSGVKRRFCDLDDEFDNDHRPPKRISPFHNTPIQKKETKRRLLKISLKKMRAIDSPEVFLRRSVLINNLAKCLQDDLKDDKIWDRFGWEGELDTFPTRSPIPVPHKPISYDLPGDGSSTSGTCTFLTNGPSSSSSSVSSSQWTLSTHARWLNGDDDAYLSPSERERVTRDLAQSHDKLAQTVERLVSFENEMSNQMEITQSTCENSNIKKSSGSFVCQNDKVLPGNQDHSRTTVVTPLNSSYQGQCSLSDCVNTCCHTKKDFESDINKNRISHDIILTEAFHEIDSEKYPNTTGHNVSGAMPSNISCSGHKGNPLNKCNPPTSNPVSVDRLQDSPSPSLLISDISNTECWIPSSQINLDPLHTCDTSLMSSSTTTATSTDTLTSSTTAATLTPICFSNSMNSDLSSSNDDSSLSLKCTFPSISCDLHEDPELDPSGAWNNDSDVGCINSSGTPTNASPGSCSAEVDRSERSLPFQHSQFSESDKFTSQGLREFDVIYNNLVSVLIGGN